MQYISKIVEFTRMMEAVNELHDINLKWVVIEARREMVAKFEEKIARGKGKMVKLKGQSKEDMLDLAQMKGNIELIGLLQGTEPPSLATEVEQLSKKELTKSLQLSWFSLGRLRGFPRVL